MTITDEIYAELKTGLWTALDYNELHLKYGKSKGPFYNALQMVFAETAVEMTKLSSELKALREKGDEEKAKLESLADQQEKAADEAKARQQEIETLEGKEQVTKARIQEISAELSASAGLLNQAQELEKMGFNREKLQQLRDAIAEIGTKQGLKPGGAIDRFFNDVQDYDAKIGFEREIQRLGTITETKRLEARNWQAKAERLESQHRDHREAIDAMQALVKRGVKADQIVSWNGIVSKLGGAEGLEKELGDYRTIREILNVRKEEAAACQLRLTKAQSHLETLEEERAKIEARIDALKVAGVKQLEAMTAATGKQLKAVAAEEIKEMRAIGEAVRSEFANYFTQLDGLSEKIFEAGQEFERSKQELQKYEGVKDALKSHAVASEAEK